MAVQSGVLDRLEQQGMGAVTVEQGLCALELASSGGAESGVVGMVPMRWPMLLRLMGNEVPAFLSDIEARARQQLPSVFQQQEPGCAVVHVTGFVASLAGQEEEALQGALQAMVLCKVQEAAGVRVGGHAPLMESGVDSLAATELRIKTAFRLFLSISPVLEPPS